MSGAITYPGPEFTISASDLEKLRRLFCETSLRQDKRRKQLRAVVFLCVGVIAAVAVFIAMLVFRHHAGQSDPRLPVLQEAPLPSPGDRRGQTETSAVLRSPAGEAQGSDSAASARTATESLQTAAAASSAIGVPDDSPQSAPLLVQPPAALGDRLPQQKDPQSPAAGSCRVQLVSVRNPESAAREITRLERRYARELGGTSLIVEQATVDGKGGFYRVITENTLSREAAEGLCGDLKRKGQSCLILRQPAR